MPKGDEITTKFSVDISSLKKGITEANRQIKLANAEFKAATGGAKNWSTSIEGVEAKITQMNKVLDAQKKKLESYQSQLKTLKSIEAENRKQVENLSNAYEAAANQYGASSSEAQAYAQQLDKAKAELERSTVAVENMTATMLNQEGTVKGTADQLGELQSALSGMTGDSGGASTATEKLTEKIQEQQKELDKLKAEYQDLVLEQGESSDEARTLAGEIDELSSDLRTNEQRLQDAADAADDLDNSLDDIDTNPVTEGFTVMKGALADLVADGFRMAIGAVKDFATGMITAAADVKAQKSQFEQTFGGIGDGAAQMGDEATAAIKRIADESGILETRLNASATSIYAFAKSSGADSAEALGLMETSLRAAADAAAYYDMPLEQATETLQSFLKGNFANDAALGVSATEFTRNAAATELFGKKYNDLSEIQKQQTLLKMVTDSQELSGAMGQASREADGWENVMGNLNETWYQFQASVGTPFLEALVPVIQDVTAKLQEMAAGVDWDAFGQKVGAVADAIAKGFGWIIENKDAIIAGLAGIGTAFAVIKIGALVAAIATFIAKVKAAAGIWAGLKIALAAIGGPVTIVIAIIAGLVAAFVTLWNKSEAFRNFWIGLWEGIKTACSEAWEGIKGFFSGALDNVKEGWGAVSEWFKSSVVEPIKNAFSSVKEGISTKFEEAKTAVTNAWAAVGEWFNGKVVTPIKNAFNGVKEAISTKFTEAKTAITTAWGAIASWFDTKVVQPIKKFFQPLVDWFTKLFESIKATITSTWEVIGQLADGCVQIIKRVWEVLGDWFNTNVVEPIRTFFTSLWDGAKQMAQGAVDGAKAAWQTVSEWFNTTVIQPITTFFTTMWNAIKQFATDTWNGIVEVWNAAAEWFNANVVEPVTEFFTNLWNDVTKFASDAWANIKNTWNAVKSWFKTNITDPVSKAFTGLWDGVKSTAKDAWESVKSTFGSVASWFKGKFTDAWTAVKNVFSTGGKIFDGIKEGILNGLKTTVNAIIRGINKVVAIPFNGLNKVLDKIRNAHFLNISPFKGLGSVSVPQIPELARGGVLKRGQVGLLEGNGTEAVVPLEKNIQWIRKVAEELKKQLNISDLIGTLRGSVGGLLQGLETTDKGLMSSINNSRSNVNNFTQIINAPKAPSRIELYRQTRNLLDLKGGIS
jgi:phage-related protein/predicted  nucleic acid-binding Zn-ribbon protein